MIIVKDILVSDDVVEQQFMCNLNACKGACCWEGDFGAPLEPEEIITLQNLYPKIRPYLTEEGKALIDDKGVYVHYKEPDEDGTPLLKNAACAFMTYDQNGVAQCGIEQAHRAGEIDFKNRSLVIFTLSGWKKMKAVSLKHLIMTNGTFVRRLAKKEKSTRCQFISLQKRP